MSDAPTNIRRPRGRTGGSAVRVISAVLSIVILALTVPFFARVDAAAAAPAVGVPEAFWVQDWSTGAYLRVQATACYVGEHVVVYVHDKVSMSEYLVNHLGTTFDETTYPTLTHALGPEPNPGIDGDPRIAILIYDFNDKTNSVDGSFNAYDIDPRDSRTSNRREMFYLNLQAIEAEPHNIGALAAHEFAHLIVYYRDVMLDPSPGRACEDLWLLEGFTTYAEHLAGYDARVSGQWQSFMNDPNFNLTFWQGVRANYGASYSFMRYLAAREGPEFVRALVDQPLDGVAGIDAALDCVGSAQTFAGLFDDWVVAAFLSARPPSLWPYTLPGATGPPRPVALIGTEPILGSGAVTNYGAIYLDFPAVSPAAAFQAVIDGADGAPLQAALISWDSGGSALPSVVRFDLANAAVGGTVTAPVGYDRHTLAVWARGAVGAVASYEFAFSGACDPPAGVQFLDMGGNDQFYEFAAILLAEGVISGKEIPSGSGLWFFAGKDNVTRAQFAKMIMLATGLHTEEIENLENPTFKDVPPVFDRFGYPYDYIEEAATLGIVNGYADGTFGPTRAITRAHLVLMVVRGATAAGRPLPVYAGNEKIFADVPPSHPYYRQIMTAYTAGIMNGSYGSDGRLYFRPGSSASRNHVAKMTANLLGHLNKGHSYGL